MSTQGPVIMQVSSARPVHPNPQRYTLPLLSYQFWTVISLPQDNYILIVSGQSHHCQWMVILSQMHYAKIMVQRHKLLLFHYNRFALMGILTCPMTWFYRLFPLRFLAMALKLIHHCVNILGQVIVLVNSVSQSISCPSLNRHCLVQIYACHRNFIPLNSVQQAVATQHLQVRTIWALIAMNSPFCVIILQMTIQAYLAMDGLCPQVACQTQWAIASPINAMLVQALVNHQLILSL